MTKNAKKTQEPEPQKTPEELEAEAKKRIEELKAQIKQVRKDNKAAVRKAKAEAAERDRKERTHWLCQIGGEVVRVAAENSGSLATLRGILGSNKELLERFEIYVKAHK